MQLSTESKLITCILAKGKGATLVGRLSEEMGISSANVASSRGRGANAIGNIGAWDEVDMLTVTVAAERAEEIFSFIFHEGGIDQPRGGIMYQYAVSPVTTFMLPDME
jgi:hypothetical protein